MSIKQGQTPASIAFVTIFFQRDPNSFNGQFSSQAINTLGRLGQMGSHFFRKGFFEFSISSLEYDIRVHASDAWNLSLRLLKLFPWTRDFTPILQQNNTTQIWVCFYGLTQKCWWPKILFAIDSCIGTPIHFEIL